MSDRINKEIPILSLEEDTKGDKKTTISIVTRTGPDDVWIKTSNVLMREVGRMGDDLWFVESFIDGATDNTHDQAKAFRIPVIGLEFKHKSIGMMRFTAWVESNRDALGDLEEFHVPDPDHDFFEEISFCDRCQEKHSFTRYLPKPDQNLYEKVKGKKLEIRIGM